MDDRIFARFHPLYCGSCIQPRQCWVSITSRKLDFSKWPMVWRVGVTEWLRKLNRNTEYLDIALVGGAKKDFFVISCLRGFPQAPRDAQHGGPVVIVGVAAYYLNRDGYIDIGCVYYFFGELSTNSLRDEPVALVLHLNDVITTHSATHHLLWQKSSYGKAFALPSHLQIVTTVWIPRESS